RAARRHRSRQEPVPAARQDGSLAGTGIQKGDYITKINGIIVTSGPEMVEQITNYKPGDKISVTYTRNGKEYTVNITLKNKAGSYDVVKAESAIDKLGAEFENYNGKKLMEYGFSGGVLVKKIKEGIFKHSRIQEGFVITSVNGQEIKTVDDFKAALKNNNSIKLEGVYPGEQGVYGYTINLETEAMDKNNGNQ
nr:PDZ domain-containing protein [Chitinophagaceae bacterium]